MSRWIDLNCDVGEGVGNEREIMPYISSANIACGQHAGDEQTMRQVIGLCIEFGVAIGAHPSFPDREFFGRRNMELPATQVEELVTQQITRLSELAKEFGASIKHVKPHGALYNMAAKNSELATAISRAVFHFDSNLILFGLSGSCMSDAAAEIGLKFYHEVFADRTYIKDGSLTPRSFPHALIENPLESADQAFRLATNAGILAEGEWIYPKADSICIHGDGALATVFAKSIHQKLKSEGITISHE